MSELLSEQGCPFCTPSSDQVIDELNSCYVMPTSDGPKGSVMVLPRAHRPTPLDLTAEEWATTQLLLARHLKRIALDFDPQGWNIGWNVNPVGGQSVDHAHCHLVPRYSDERFAGRGIRSWIKSPENERTPKR